MKTIALFFTFLALFSFSGCNWAEPPLPEPNADLDERLLGEWKSTGVRKYHLEITRLKDRHYEVTLRGGTGNQETVSKWRGYHTDIDDLRVISLEFLGWKRPNESKEMPEGRQHRWICLSYELSSDGFLEPKFISHAVLPGRNSPTESLEVTGEEVYEAIKNNWRMSKELEPLRETFFESTERVVFQRAGEQE